MTSTILSGKTFPKLYKWSLRRNKAIMVIFAVLMALGLILDLYLISELSRDRVQVSTINEQICEVGFVSIIIAQGGAMLLTFISALLTFSFLHDKRSTDMFGALPTTRGTTYLAHLLGGLTAVEVPFIVGSLIVVGITCRSAEYLATDALLILNGILGITASYTLTSVIACCCGTILDTAIITIAVNGIYAGSVGLFWGLASEMIPGIDFESIFNVPTLTLFTPFAHCFFGDFYFIEGEFTAYIFVLVWSFIFTAGMVALGLFTAIRRTAESAQSETNIKWLPIAVKAGVSVVSGGLIGTVAAMSSSSGYANMVIFAFWYTATSFVAFFILHVIFQRGLKGKFLPSFVTYLATTVAILALVFGMTGGLGIDKFVPAPITVRSVEFDYGDVYKDPENIKIITEIHKLITEGVQEDNGYPYYLGYDDSNYNTYTTEYDDYDYYSDDLEIAATSDLPEEEKKELSFNEKYPLTANCDFSFKYSKKVGFATIRDYYISSYGHNEYYDFDKIEALLQKLYNSEEHKKQSNPAIWNKELRSKAEIIESPKLEYMIYTGLASDSEYRYSENELGYFTAGTAQLPMGEKFLDGLYDALAKDILADEYYYVNDIYAYSGKDNSGILGDSYMKLTVRCANDYDRTYYLFDEYRYDRQSLDVYVKIPKYYKNTIAYLESNFIRTKYDPTGFAAALDAPTDLLKNNSTAFNNYISFGLEGSDYSLTNLVSSISVILEIKGCTRADLDIDTFEWYNKHGAEFLSVVTDEALELFEEYKKDPKNITSDYSTPFLENNDAPSDGEYFKIADMILTQLDKDCESIVKSIN